MIPAKDWYVLLECVHSKNWNNHLPCEFPEACRCCIYHEIHGTHKVKKALKIYHDYQKYLKEEFEKDCELY